MDMSKIFGWICVILVLVVGVGVGYTVIFGNKVESEIRSVYKDLYGDKGDNLNEWLARNAWEVMVGKERAEKSKNTPWRELLEGCKELLKKNSSEDTIKKYYSEEKSTRKESGEEK